MGQLLERMKMMHERAQLGGSEKSREKHVARGRMLVRE